jgi:diguanylate cyclase (GGDEF)-like protein
MANDSFEAKTSDMTGSPALSRGVPNLVPSRSSYEEKHQRRLERKFLAEVISERQLTAVFQQIVDVVSGSILGYEALTRCTHEKMGVMPVSLFELARRNDMAFELDVACHQIQCRQFSLLGLTGKLFINASTTVILNHDRYTSKLLAILKEACIRTENVVIEVSEEHTLDDAKHVRAAMDALRSAGFEIAMDDLGAGYSGLKIWSELLPDYVKIDRHFIERLDLEPVKRKFVNLIKELGADLGCRIIAEGVESESEAKALGALGIRYHQGFYYAMPSTYPDRQLASHLSRHIQSRHLTGLESTVADLCVQMMVAPPNCSVEAVMGLFMGNPGLACLPVCAGETPVGIAYRSDISRILSKRYGWDLYAKRNIVHYVSEHSLILDHKTPLSDASRLITDNPDYDLNLDFIVTVEGKYQGVVKPKMLLKRITEQQIRAARYSNPLTGLPGNVPLNEFIDNCLTGNEDFFVAYIDIDNFKPFNDFYGYGRGDDVIKFTRDILVNHLESTRDTVFHVGGDDFVAVMTDGEWYSRLRTCTVAFAKGVLQFYNTSHVEDGGINSTNRAGERTFFPLMNVSIGVVRPDPQRVRGHHDVATLAADAKKEAKRIMETEKIFFSRRRGLSPAHGNTCDSGPVT